jgi:hypothetical protein
MAGSIPSLTRQRKGANPDEVRIPCGVPGEKSEKLL